MVDVPAACPLCNRVVTKVHYWLVCRIHALLQHTFGGSRVGLAGGEVIKRCPCARYLTLNMAVKKKEITRGQTVRGRWKKSQPPVT